MVENLDFDVSKKLFKEKIQIQEEDIHESLQKLDVDANYICLICQSILYHPLSCKQCHAKYCKSCIEKWDKHNCPQCRRDIKLVQPHPNFMRHLNTYHIKGCPMESCEKKNSEMTYMEVVRHLQTECGRMNARCHSVNCNQKFLRSQWETHYLACDYIIYACKICEFYGERYEFDEHECIYLMRDSIDRLKLELSEQKKLFEQEKENITKSIKDSYINNMKEIVNQLKIFKDKNQQLTNENNELKRQISYDIYINNDNLDGYTYTENASKKEVTTTFKILKDNYENQMSKLQDEVNQLRRELNLSKHQNEQLARQYMNRIEPLFSKMFGFNCTKQIYQLYSKSYCKQHNEELLEFNNKDRDYRCDFCGNFFFKFKDNNNGWECKVCKLNICTSCINNSNSFISK